MFKLCDELISEMTRLISPKPLLVTDNGYMMAGCHGCSGCTSCDGCDGCNGNE